MGGLLRSLFSKGGDYTDAEALRKAMNDPQAVIHLVDVRTPEEFAEAHIPGATNIPYDEIGFRPPTEGRDEAIVVYCRSGNRSGSAERTLRKMGYRNVTNFGGLRDWPFEVVDNS